VDDEVDTAAAHECDDRVTLVDAVDVDFRELERARRSFGRDELEAESDQVTRNRDDAELVVVADGEESSTAGGKCTACGSLRACKSLPESARPPHHPPCAMRILVC